MNPKLRSKLTIIIAVIVVLGITLFFADNPSTSEGITILEEDLFCNTYADCTEVTISCDGCDCGSLVNKASLEKYQNLYKETCENYQGERCSLRCEPLALRCFNNKCVS